MEKYVYQLTDFAHRASGDNKNWVISDNLKKFTLPDVEPGSNEVSGYSGLNGTIQLVDWNNLGAMDMSLTYSTEPECSSTIVSPSKVFHQFSWIEEYVDKNHDKGYCRHKVYITSMLKKLPGGDYSKGESGEREYSYAVNAYRKVRYMEDGTEDIVIDYDPLNKKLILGNEDYSESLNTELAGF